MPVSVSTCAAPIFAQGGANVGLGPAAPPRDVDLGRRPKAKEPSTQYLRLGDLPRGIRDRGAQPVFGGRPPILTGHPAATRAGPDHPSLARKCEQDPGRRPRSTHDRPVSLVEDELLSKLWQFLGQFHRSDGFTTSPDRLQGLLRDPAIPVFTILGDSSGFHHPLQPFQLGTGDLDRRRVVDLGDGRGWHHPKGPPHPEHSGQASILVQGGLEVGHLKRLHSRPGGEVHGCRVRRVEPDQVGSHRGCAVRGLGEVMASAEPGSALGDGHGPHRHREVNGQSRRAQIGMIPTRLSNRSAFSMICAGRAMILS